MSDAGGKEEKRVKEKRKLEVDPKFFAGHAKQAQPDPNKRQRLEDGKAVIDLRKEEAEVATSILMYIIIAFVRRKPSPKRKTRKLRWKLRGTSAWRLMQ
jgi:hypothetical protein